MPKKRTLTVVLVLFPLAIGAAVIASVANGKRAGDVDDSLLIPEASHQVMPRQADEITPAALPAAPLDASLPQTVAPASNDEVKAPAADDKDQRAIEGDETSEGPLFANATAPVPQLAAADASQFTTAAPRFAGGSYGAARVRGGSGSSGGKGASTQPIDAMPSDTDASTETPADPAGSTPTDPAKGEQEGDETEGQDETSGPQPEEELPYFPPEPTHPPAVQVPEPGPLGLFGLGLLICALVSRRTQRT